MTNPPSLNPELLARQRIAFLPKTSEGDGSICESKFSGRPWLAEDEPWLACQNCNTPMQLFVQLNLEELPEHEQKRLGNKGLIQLFYCVSSDPLCEVICEAYFPFASSVLPRFIENPGPKTNATAQGPDSPFPARRIEGWEALPDDMPGAEEAYALGLEPSEEDMRILEDMERPAVGDKLGGWPAWVQGVEYPSCPHCQSQMELVLQIDSNDNLPYMFGDMGTGHLTRCPHHPETLAFAWACY